jgi:hypothetical protein
MKEIMESGVGRGLIVLRTMNLQLSDWDPVGYREMQERVLTFMELSGDATSH